MCTTKLILQVYDGHMRLSIEVFVHWGVSTAAAILVSTQLMSHWDA